MIDLITILSFLSVSGALFVMAEQMRRAQQDPVKRRLATANSMPGMVSRPKSGSNALWGSFADQLPQPDGSKSEIEFELRQAGYFHPRALNVFLGLRNGIVISVVIATAALIVLIGPEREPAVVRIGVVGLAIAALCWGLPRILLKSRAQRRVKRISASLPYALDLTTMCLGGGLSLRDSLEHVSSEIGQAHPDLSGELAIVLRQGEMGSMESGFGQFASRMNNPEVSALVALIVQNQQLGTNVAQTIRDFSEDTRLKWRQVADEQAASVGVHMLFPVVFCLLPAVFILLWGPAALELTDFFRNIEDRVGELPDLSTLSELGR